jgi:putative addiction module component (TIGR02574 family)
MSTGVSNILFAAMSLPESDRASIALELLHSLRPPGVLSEEDPGFFEELERRSDAHDRDPSRALPWDEVERSIRQSLKDSRKL